MPPQLQTAPLCRGKANHEAKRSSGAGRTSTGACAHTYMCTYTSAGEISMNTPNKKETVAACWRAVRGGGGGQMGKSIGCVRNDLNGLHFLAGHQKVILHPKACIDCTHPACSPRESRGISAGGIFTVFIFCIRIRVGVGDDQCLFNVAAGIKT